MVNVNLFGHVTSVAVIMSVHAVSSDIWLLMTRNMSVALVMNPLYLLAVWLSMPEFMIPYIKLGDPEYIFCSDKCYKLVIDMIKWIS